MSYPIDLTGNIPSISLVIADGGEIDLTGNIPSISLVIADGGKIDLTANIPNIPLVITDGGKIDLTANIPNIPLVITDGGEIDLTANGPIDLAEETNDLASGIGNLRIQPTHDDTIQPTHDDTIQPTHDDTIQPTHDTNDLAGGIGNLRIHPTKQRKKTRLDADEAQASCVPAASDFKSATDTLFEPVVDDELAAAIDAAFDACNPSGTGTIIAPHLRAPSYEDMETLLAQLAAPCEDGDHDEPKHDDVIAAELGACDGDIETLLAQLASPCHHHHQGSQQQRQAEYIDNELERDSIAVSELLGATPRQPLIGDIDYVGIVTRGMKRKAQTANNGLHNFVHTPAFPAFRQVCA
jgi:hypothetical protein